MKAALPASTAPTGQPSPLLRSIHTLSKGLSETARLHSARHYRVHQPRTVHVHAQPVLGRERREGIDRVHRPDRAPAEVRALLHRDERAARHVAIPRANRGARLRLSEDARSPVHRKHRGTAQHGGAARFQDDDVRSAIRDDLVAGAAMNQECNLVAHRAGGQEDGGLLAQKRRHFFAERVYARVLVALFVAYRRFGHRAAHFRAGPGLGIAVKIDHCIVSASLCGRAFTTRARCAGAGVSSASAAATSERAYCPARSSSRAAQHRRRDKRPQGSDSIGKVRRPA